MIVPASANVNAIQKEGVRGMSVLSTEARKKIPSSEYGLPEKAPASGSYPIQNIEHARAALRLDHNATPEERKRIEAKVRAKYPSIGARYKPGK